MFRSIRVLPAITSAILCLCSCGKQAVAERGEEGRLTVAASIAPLEYFAREIGGERVEVMTIAPGNADPETFEPSMMNLRKASDASMLLTTGLLPFEERLAGVLQNSDKSLLTLNLSDSLLLIEGSHGGEADPHIWASLRNARTMGRNTLRGMIAASPADSAYFTRRWEQLDHRLDSLDRALTARLAPCRGAAFLVWHPSLSYFARDYSLRQIALGSEHKEPSVSGLRERLSRADATEVRAFFFQQEFDSRQSDIVTSATGLKPVSISPMDADITRPLIQAADIISSSEVSH